MEYTRAFVIPESWVKEASKQIADLNDVEPLYLIVPISNYEKLTKARLRKLIMKTIRASSLHNAVVILPTSYANGLYVKYWPDMYIRQKSEILITSVLFADKWSECGAVINSWVAFSYSSNSKKYNATCQYQNPYTDTLELWSEKGAQSFHPGDYFKHEFLIELKKMHGHWLYWGHADSEQLHGYNNISVEDILNYRPDTPLQSTLWFSCSTLDINKERNIALDWFLNGATYCLFASMGSVKTIDNQILSSAWIEMCQLSNVSNVADIIQNILKQDQLTFHPILANYRLMGLPWVKFS